MCVASGGDLGSRKLGLFVDSEIVLSLDTVRPGCLSTRPYQQRQLITEQDLINRDNLSTRFDSW